MSVRGIVERLVDGHEWLRVADPSWQDPLDASFADARGGRWNSPGAGPTLYLNEDRVTARINVERFVERWPYEPEDLREDTAPTLISVVLPPGLDVADVHSPEGVAAVGLPDGYPLDARGRLVGHDVCRPIGDGVRRGGLAGVRCRAATSPRGAGRELAWFPRAGESARAVRTEPFAHWYFA